MAPSLPWTDNIWMDVSVEAKPYLYRIDYLRHTSAAIKFISFEPLLESLGAIDLRGIDWVIVGGESGPGARPMKRLWVIEILQACRQADVPFFFKQWGGTNKKRVGRLLDGRTWDEVPERTAREASSCKLTSTCSR